MYLKTMFFTMVFLTACSATAPPIATPPPDNINTHTILMVAALCEANEQAWQDYSTAEWLSQNIGGLQGHWQYATDRWTYTVGPESVGFSWNYTPPYKMGFQYPGFGSISVNTYDGNVVTINEANAGELPQLKFTRLELTCP